MTRPPTASGWTAEKMLDAATLHPPFAVIRGKNTRHSSRALATSPDWQLIESFNKLLGVNALGKLRLDLS